MKSLFFTLSVILNFYTFCVSQQALEKVYDVTLGLMYQEVTNIWKDDQEVLWVEYSNQTGISSFDGLSWTHFEFQDYGMPIGLEFVKINSEGMWFVRYHKNSGELEVVLFNKKKNWKYWKVNGMLVKDIFHVNSDLMYFSDNLELFACKEREFMQIAILPKNIKEENHRIIDYTYMDKNHVVITYGNHLSNNLIKKMVLYDINKGKIVHSVNLKNSDQYPWFLAPFMFINVTSDLVLTDIRNEKLVKVFPKNSELQRYTRIKYAEINGKYTFMFSVLNVNKKKDIYYFDEKKNTIEVLYTNLDNGLMSDSGIIDKNNNIWYASQNGLFKRTPQIITFLENNSKMVNGLFTIAEDNLGRIWFGGYNNSGWMIWDGKKFKKPKDKALTGNRILPGAAYIKDKLYYFEEDNAFTKVKYIQNESKKSIFFPELVSTGYYFTAIDSGKVAAGMADIGLLIFDQDNPLKYSLINKAKGLHLENILCISEDKNHRIWMGRASQGIACYDPNLDTVVTWLITQDNPKSLGMMASIIDKSGTLWLGTSQGLSTLPNPHLFDITELSLFKKLKHIPLPIDSEERILSLAEYRNYIIAGGEKCVYFIDKGVPTDEEGRMRVYALHYYNDIPGKGSEQNSILIDSKGFLWLGTQEGALRIDLDKYKFDTTKTNLQLTSVKFGNNQVGNYGGDIIGPKGIRSVNISWSVSSNPYFQDNVLITAGIISESNDTIFIKNQTKDNNLNIPYLSPGKYKLIIRTYKNNQLNYILTKTIIVPKLLTEKVWFWSLLALTITLIPFLILLNISKLKRRDAEYKLKIENVKRNQDSFRIKSLSNFFNPHFINNTLHWIQSKYRKDEETATMIDSLARNVELIYQNIQLGTIYHSLKKELELVDNYLSIQQVRFSHMLEINILVDDTLNSTALFVPSMLLQLHVENAVDKGIRYRKGAGVISIYIKDDDPNLKIYINDDGIGRHSFHAPLEKRNGSTKVMDELINILNDYNNSKITVEYNDLIIDRKYGTSVMINIPKKFTYEIEKI